jgi:cell division protein FtsI (penicillin-binding protein 3)
MQWNSPTRRLHVLLWALVLWSGALMGRLVWLQVHRHGQYAELAARQHQHRVRLPAVRGAILDRTGQPLAVTLESDSVALDPRIVSDPVRAAERLGRVLGMAPGPLARRLAEAKARKSKFLWVARKLTPEESRRVRMLRVESLRVQHGAVFVNPQKIEDPDLAARALAPVLGRDADGLERELHEQRAAGTRQLRLARDITPQQEDALRELMFDGLILRKEMRRFYPRTTLAAHVLGSVGYVRADDEEEHGNAGIEQFFDRDLQGVPGEAQLLTDSGDEVYDEIVLRAPAPGAELTLTLDPNLQFRAEQELENAAVASGAEGGSVVAMDPYTGDILAMASYPRFDPNTKPAPGEAALWARQNQAVARTFEPGSVFKVITLAAALETTALTPQSLIDCGNGRINLFGRVIHDHDPYGTLTMAGVLAHSSNVGAIRIGLAVGNEKLYEYQRRFGFGMKTGIPLPGESPGILHPVGRWTKSSIGSLAMGHEIGVTSLQLARAGAAVANGGTLVKPRLVLSRRRAGEEPEVFPPQPGERILRPETAIQLRQMMEGVVLEGTGRRAVLQGYTSGGKTGSAQIYDPKTRTYTHTYNASFLGFAPVGNPRVVIAVTLHGTKGGAAGYGGARAAPVFREVALAALRILGVPKDLPDRVLLASKSSKLESDLAAPGPDDGAVALAAARLAAAEETSSEFPFSGDVERNPNKAVRGVEAAQPSELAYGDTVRVRAVSSVTPPLARGGTPVAAGDPSTSQRLFFPEEAPLAKMAGGVPDFRGKTLRAVLQESAAAGVPVEWSGFGLASRQDPPPGAVLRPGMAVKVQFGR